MTIDNFNPRIMQRNIISHLPHAVVYCKQRFIPWVIKFHLFVMVFGFFQTSISYLYWPIDLGDWPMGPIWVIVCIPILYSSFEVIITNKNCKCLKELATLSVGSLGRIQSSVNFLTFLREKVRTCSIVVYWYSVTIFVLRNTWSYYFMIFVSICMFLSYLVIFLQF